MKTALNGIFIGFGIAFVIALGFGGYSYFSTPKKCYQIVLHRFSGFNDTVEVVSRMRPSIPSIMKKFAADDSIVGAHIEKIDTLQ